MLGLSFLKRRRRPSSASPEAFSSCQRSGARFLLPFGASALAARLESGSAEAFEVLRGQLWNISDRGGCLTLPPQCRLACPLTAVLTCCDPSTRQQHRFEVELRWISTVSHATFVGLFFRSGLLPQDSFLRDYMKSSWTDGVPAARTHRRAAQA